MTDIEYVINGVNMGSASNNSMGWVVLRNNTSALGGITRTLNKVQVPGYDGYFQAPSTRTDQTLVLNIRTPRENLESLLALVSHVGRDVNFPTLGTLEIAGETGKAAYFELASALPSSSFPSDSMVNLTTTLVIPYGGWRDEDVTSTVTAVTLNPQVLTGIATGSSLPIADMDVFISGDVGTMQITDSAGSWLRTTSYYDFSAGNGLFYQGSTGRAYRATDASPWVPTADLGFAVDSSGGGFRMTPTFDTSTPETRSVQLTVLSTQLVDVSVTIRWRGAYVLR